MLHVNYFPTQFAKRLAERVGIKVEEWGGALHEFQQMALVCSFEDSMIAFAETDVTPEQVEVLKIIYTHTKPWALGCVMGELFQNLQTTKGKDAAVLIMDKILKQGEDLSDAELNKLIGAVFGKH